MRGFLKYHIKDRWVLWKQSQDLRSASQPPILVFTMAKVGSLSVYNSLKRHGTAAVFHIHSLDSIAEGNHIAYCKEKGIYPGSRTPVFLLQKELIEKKKPYKVISLFRDPIERNISAFFDAFRVHVGQRPEHYQEAMEDLEKIFHRSLDHNYARQWFEAEFFAGTGINVYDHHFDPEMGHGRIAEDGIEMLLLKNTLDNDLKAQLIREFCGLGAFDIENVNVTSASASGTLYQDFRAHIRFSDDYLKSQLDSDYAKHFFTEEERASSYKKWAADTTVTK